VIARRKFGISLLGSIFKFDLGWFDGEPPSLFRLIVFENFGGYMCVFQVQVAKFLIQFGVDGWEHKYWLFTLPIIVALLNHKEKRNVKS